MTSPSEPTKTPKARTPSDRGGNGRLDATSDAIDDFCDLWITAVNLWRRMAISAVGMAAPMYSAVEEAQRVAHGALNRSE